MKKERWPLKSTYNTRDLGGYALPEGGATDDRLIRSDYYGPIAPEDQAFLLGKGLCLVIDLRDDLEVKNRPSVFADRTDVGYCRVSLIPPEAVRKMGAAMTEAQSDILFLMGDAYIYALDQRQAELAEIFRLILGCLQENPQGRVLFHCSAGKDRTGVVAALLLLLAGAEEQDVIADYALTEEFLQPVMARQKAEVRAHGVIDEKVLDAMFASPPENMRRMIDHIQQKYGGVAAYFVHLGFSEEEIQALRGLMRK